MAQARKCDRCGKFYKYYPVNDTSSVCNAIICVRIDSAALKIKYREDHMDLCQNCMDDFRDFMDEYELQK